MVAHKKSSSYYPHWSGKHQQSTMQSCQNWQDSSRKSDNERDRTDKALHRILVVLIKFYFGTYDEDETPQTPSSSSDGCEDNGIDFENHSSDTLK